MEINHETVSEIINEEELPRGHYNVLTNQLRYGLIPKDANEGLRELAQEIRRCHDEFCYTGQAFVSSRDRLIKHAKECGNALIKARALLKPREFAPWIERNCGFSTRTAYRYIESVSSATGVARIESEPEPTGLVDKLVKWVRTSFTRRLPAPEEALSWPIEDQRKLRAELEPIARLVDRLPKEQEARP